MNCLLCAASNHFVPAVGVCHHCGAAVCHDHAQIDHTAAHPGGMIGAAQAATRRIHCTHCAVAPAAAR
jgi:hypothetical protein